MNYWIFVANYWKLPDGSWLDSRDIVRTRTEQRFWGLGEKTPNRKSVSRGDKLVFYAGGGESQVLMGTATLTSDPYVPSAERLTQVPLGEPDKNPDYGVDLDDVELWAVPKPMRDLVPHLSFIQNKDFWGTYLQGGIRSISPADYVVITEGVRTDLAQQIARQPDLESSAEFALEQHLEEFIQVNWASIDFGAPLALYEAEGQTGRQFPAGPPGSNWSIDFLAVDKKSGEFVVIELKKGRSSDSVAGQVLRYMAWVKENLAGEGQDVRGVVIVKEVDDALRYALRAQPVDIKTYEVKFRLSDAGSSRP